MNTHSLAASKPIFARAIEHLGKLQIETRTYTVLQTTMDKHQPSNKAQAMKDSKLKLHSKIYTDGSKKTKRSDTQ
jgi:hypothetical protein